jgi:hypothetical protein
MVKLMGYHFCDHIRKEYHFPVTGKLSVLPALLAGLDEANSHAVVHMARN